MFWVESLSSFHFFYPCWFIDWLIASLIDLSRMSILSYFLLWFLAVLLHDLLDGGRGGWGNRGRRRIWLILPVQMVIVKNRKVTVWWAWWLCIWGLWGKGESNVVDMSGGDGGGEKTIFFRTYTCVVVKMSIVKGLWYVWHAWWWRGEGKGGGTVWGETRVSPCVT